MLTFFTFISYFLLDADVKYNKISKVIWLFVREFSEIRLLLAILSFYNNRKRKKLPWGIWLWTMNMASLYLMHNQRICIVFFTNPHKIIIFRQSSNEIIRTPRTNANFKIWSNTRNWTGQHTHNKEEEISKKIAPKGERH